LDFGVKVGAAQPDDIWDFCVSRPDRYAWPIGQELRAFAEHVLSRSAARAGIRHLAPRNRQLVLESGRAYMEQAP
jgi:hypothetical protein